MSQDERKRGKSLGKMSWKCLGGGKFGELRQSNPIHQWLKKKVTLSKKKGGICWEYKKS